MTVWVMTAMAAILVVLTVVVFERNAKHNHCPNSGVHRDITAF